MVHALRATQPGNIATLTTLSGLWCLVVLDFVQKIPFTHEDVPLPVIDIVPSQLLLYYCQLMAHLSQQRIHVEDNHRMTLVTKCKCNPAGYHTVCPETPNFANACQQELLGQCFSAE